MLYFIRQGIGKYTHITQFYTDGFSQKENDGSQWYKDNCEIFNSLIVTVLSISIRYFYDLSSKRQIIF